MRVVHLPMYSNNQYQALLMSELEAMGHETINGGGGGRFIGVALREWKPDILHLHWTHPYMLRPSRLGTIMRSTRFLAALKVLRRRGTRIVWTLHNLSNHEKHQVQLERFFLRRLARVVDQMLVHCPDALEQACEWISPVLADRSTVVEHASWVGCYEDRIDRDTAREQLGLDRGSTVFLFLGQVRVYKGITDLLEAFSQVDGLNLRLLVAGRPDPPEAGDAVREHSDPRILSRLEFIPDDQLQVYYRAADVAVLPYRDILSSGSALLAQTFGRPIIAPRLGCLPHVIGGGGGLLYDPVKPGALAEAMRDAISRSDEWAGMAAWNRQQAEANTWKAMAKKIEQVYQTVAGR